MDLSDAQKTLLHRVLDRMKKMNMKIEAFPLARALRVNEMPPESVEQVRQWLLTIEPETANGPGVDEKGAEKKMAGNTTQKSWIDIDDENSSAGYIKFASGDRKVLKIVTNPIAGPIDFKQPDGTVKTNFGLQIDVMEGDSPEIKNWKVTSKSIRDQLKGICRNYGMGPNLAGSVLRVMANGDGLKRTYFVELLQKPGQTMPQQPVQNPGQQWPQEQGVPAGGH